MTDPFDGLPFRALTPSLRARLSEGFTEERFSRGTRIMAKGDTGDEQVYILLEGTVEVLDPSRGAERVVGRIGAGHYFGERRALFGTPRAFDIRAVSDVVTVSFPGVRLREVVGSAPVFAWSLARILRDKQGLFSDFERFLTEVQRDAGRGHLVIPRLLHLYKRLQPALHSLASSDAIDFDALDYVVPRLPADITQTLSLFLTDELPWLYSRPDRTFDTVRTRARRRTAYRMMPGKILVLLRAGLSDLLDLVCCLCVLAVEARKLRRRLTDPELLAACEHDESTPLPFSDEELARLEALWPGEVRRRLHEVAVRYSVVTPYSSMIVLVNEAQLEALRKASEAEDRFDRESESGSEQLSKPHSPMEVSGAPEPEEWLLILLACGMLFQVGIMHLKPHPVGGGGVVQSLAIHEETVLRANAD